MKTIQELRDILEASPWARINAHVHTHLCDGRPEMTVKNIGRAAKEAGIRLVVLTPHFHRRVDDASESFYADTDEAILLQLREEIRAYEDQEGETRFLLSTEADILSQDGEMALPSASVAKEALDLITPTMNYHPLLPLRGVHLTYGRDRDAMHQSGEYARMAQAAGGIPQLLNSLYATQANALRRAPYPALLGHFFAAHSFATKYNWFGAREEDLPLMKAGAEEVLDTCVETGAMVDITGVILKDRTPAQQREKDGFLYEFQQWFLAACRARDIPYFPGSDAHSLSGLGESRCYGELFEATVTRTKTRP